jgi:hypothetical protein
MKKTATKKPRILDLDKLDADLEKLIAVNAKVDYYGRLGESFRDKWNVAVDEHNKLNAEVYKEIMPIINKLDVAGLLEVIAVENDNDDNDESVVFFYKPIRAGVGGGILTLVIDLAEKNNSLGPDDNGVMKKVIVVPDEEANDIYPDCNLPVAQDNDDDCVVCNEPTNSDVTEKN